jgi:IS1 family transposase
LNEPIFEKLASGNTQRRTARLLRCSKHTVARKLIWIAKFMDKGVFSTADYLHLQIDELETIEHTKLKPLTVPLCVNHKYKILEVTVGKIKAKGHLAQISMRKYGPREDQRVQALTELFESLKKQVPIAPLSITTDSQPLYPGLVKKYFPGTEHIVVVSRDHLKKKRELIYTAEQKKVFDPMFALNQRCAMLRADIRRLCRRSWCTTKKIENLQYHLKLYQAYNNLQLI